MTEPTLSHDIEEWIKDHSHAAIYASLGRMYATHQLLEDRVAELEVLAGMRAKGLEERVARLETWVIQNEPHFETDDGAIEHLPQEPRGPHD